MKTILPKFKFKGDAIVINPPVDLKNEFIDLGFKTAFDKKDKSTNTLFFVNNKK